MATQVALTGTMKRGDATIDAEIMAFVPTHTMHDAAGNIIVRAGQKVTATPNSVTGAWTITLYANDDPTTLPTGTGYAIYQGKTFLGTFVVPYTAPSGTISLADLSPATITANVAYTSQASFNAHAHGVPTFKKSGMYYGPGLTYTTLSPTLEILYAIPYLLGKATTIDRLAVDVIGTTATAIARIGVYSDTGTGYPSAVLVQTAALDVSAPGLVTGTVSVELPAGIIWMAYVAQVATTSIRAFTAAGVQFPVGVTTPGTSVQIAYTEAGVTGALTDPWTSTVATAGGTMPRTYFRVV